MPSGIKKTLAGITIGRTAANKVALHGATPTIQSSHIADAKVNYTEGDLDAESEVITALNTTNGKINSILAALEAKGIVATS